MNDKTAPTTGEIIIMAAGAVMLVFSFVDFAGNTTAWGTFWFPIATLLPIYGVVMAVAIALAKFANVKLPDKVAGFTLTQLYVAVAAMAGLMAIAWLITDTGGKKIGQWFEILGGIALVVGAAFLQRERSADTAS
jgi:hypothetical protein